MPATSPRPRARRTTAALALTALALLSTTACRGGDDQSQASADTRDHAGHHGASSSAAASTAPTSSTSVSASASSSAPTTASAGSSTGASASSSGRATTVPVYFVGATPQGPRLFREWHRVTGDPLLAAARLAVGGPASDPDYRTVFPAGSAAQVTGVVHDGDRFSVMLSGNALSGRRGLTAQQARLGVQALLRTLEGVAQAHGRLVALSGGAPTYLLGAATSQGIGDAPSNDVMAGVNVTAPEQGARVREVMSASGVANSYEANVPWQVTDASGTVLKKGYATAAGYGDKLYPWKVTIDVTDLRPGSYVFTASTDDPSGGEGGGPTTDTKTFRVG